MVTLNHQKFWQPTPNPPQRCSSIGSETQTIVVAEQLHISGESREPIGYSLENNVPQEEHRVMNFASEIGQLPRPVSPDVYHNDASATDNYPEYPEEVGLYPSSRVSSTPSVDLGQRESLISLRTTTPGKAGEHNHRQFTASRRKRALEDPSISSPKRRRYPNSTTMNATKSRGRRTSQPEAESSSFHGEEGYAGNHLAGLRNAIRYLKRFHSLATAEAKFSDDLADADILKENLAVLQLATKTLQHAYGIIATSAIAIEDPFRQATTVQARQTITRRKWAVEDDRRLLKLKDSQKLPWIRIRDLFPRRTLSATSKQSESPSSKENHSNLPGQHVKCTSNVRRSQRLGRPHQVKDTKSEAERHRRYPSRAVKHSGDSNVLRLDTIDPRLRNLG
ncbi:hypothetical protein N7486_000543 [Penicillium sp. IBT 16267x]|nr:hypothetical protein N7486_000543 [Penicillium sp. IBT 16267x]